jgi:hypothetical protein
MPTTKQYDLIDWHTGVGPLASLFAASDDQLLLVRATLW